MRAATLTKIWMQTHRYISLFFVPVALLYAVTGGLYIMGVHGATDQQAIEVATDTPLLQETQALQAFVKAQLQSRDMPVPQGDARFVRGRFLWGPPVGYHVMVESKAGSSAVRIQCNTPSFYSRLVMLHKAKCGTPFKVLGIAFAVAMAAIYFSGIVIGWRARPQRAAFILTLAGGALVTLVVLLASM